jgi:O-antigen/teichoic acid export membrane protein
LVIGFIAFTLGWTFTHLLTGIFISARKAEYVFVKNSVITSGLKLVVLVFLSVFAASFAFSNIYYSWGIAVIASIIISFLILMPRIRKAYKARISMERSPIKPMMRFSAGNYIAIFFGQAPILLLPLLITNIVGSDITAYFYLAMMMSGLLFIIPSAVGTSLLSEMSHEEVNYHDKIKKAALFIAILLSIGIIVFLLLGDELLLLFGPSYAVNASTALKIFAISSIPLSVNGIFVAIKNAKKQVRYVILVNAAVAIGTLTMSLMFMTEYGLYGISTAWLISQSVVAGSILISFLFRRKSK